MIKNSVITNKTFLVTGGAGFIGSNTCEYLLNNNNKVICLDNLSTGHMSNIQELMNNVNFTFINGSITDEKLCLKVCKEVDYIIHFAAMISVPKSINEPVECVKQNIFGMVNILEAARVNGVKRVVFATSSAVYGQSAPIPNVEGKEDKVISPYALSKKNDEEWAELYTRVYNLPCYGLRFFNVYGKRQDPNSAYAAVIPAFVNKLINNQAPTIYGDGKQSRDFVFVDDVIQAIMCCFNAEEKYAGNIYNVASGQQVNLLELYDIIAKEIGADFQPKFEPARNGDIKHSSANIEKIQKEIGYKANYQLQDGLKITLEWYQESCNRG